MSPRQFHRRLLAEIRGLRVVSARASIVVGTSGGADSMALLDGLAALAYRRDAQWRLHAAHLNHGIRPRAAARDAAFVRRQAERLGLPCHEQCVDTPSIAKRDRSNLEETARRLRYAFLEQTAGRVGALLIAVGHHADDQAETILHHVIRGTGLRGLAGMPACRPVSEASPIQLIRPLLAFRRADLEAYLKARGVSYQTDRSNADVRYTRNLLRRRVLPLLEREINPRTVEALLRLSKQTQAAADMVAQQAAELLPPVLESSMGPRGRGSSEVPRETRVVISLAAFRECPALVQAEAIRQALRRAGAGLREVGFERLTAAADVLIHGRGGARVEFPGGFAAVRRGRNIVVERVRPT
ncbi:MAG: tRNA lysidine(34) synthetase TilS [Phycisphaerae bacterium]